MGDCARSPLQFREDLSRLKIGNRKIGGEAREEKAPAATGVGLFFFFLSSGAPSGAYFDSSPLASLSLFFFSLAAKNGQNGKMQVNLGTRENRGISSVAYANRLSRFPLLINHFSGEKDFTRKFPYQAVLIAGSAPPPVIRPIALSPTSPGKSGAWLSQRR